MRKIAALSVVCGLGLGGCTSSVGIKEYNEEPNVNILLPTDGAEVNEGDQVDFQGNVKDDNTPAELLIVQWASSIDGVLSEESLPDATGLVTFSTSSLSVGNHTILLKGIDERGEEGQYTIQLTVVDVPDAPTIQVVHPISGEAGEEGVEFGFSAQVSDEQDDPGDMLVQFYSNLSGTEPFCTPVADAAGLAACDYALEPGDHTLTFRVTDSDGLDISANVLFPVLSTMDVDNDGDGFTENQRDCDDANPAVNALATEVYNNIDDDCDNLIDEGTENFDDDFDGQRELDGDCDDDDNSTYLGAPETCDARDNDCDFIVDESTQCYDDDGDGYTEVFGDCDDTSALALPGGSEVEDGLDNNCDGTIDEGTPAYDDDLDGYSENAGDCNDANNSINPLGTETCDGYDNDCNGSADEENSTGCSTYYYDSDGDGYGRGDISSRCLCAPASGYTSPYPSDCYDYNASANPSATTPSSSSRGDGSFDWNCDGNETKQDTSVGNCSWSFFSCAHVGGWQSVPACGNSNNYITGCSLSGFANTSCDDNTQTRTQSCL